MAVRKGGLNKGKGLETLIPQKMPRSTTDHASVNPEPEIKVVEKIVEKVVEKPADIFLKLSEIVPNSEQPRKDFDEDALMELSESIKQFGVLQPLLVQEKRKILRNNRR